MIFASDLDRTLIFSKRFIVDYETNIIAVEKKEGTDIAFMSMKSLSLLKQISERSIFIPATSRSMEQFNRIYLHSQGINYKYAITASGGIIIKENSIDLNWQNIVQNQMKQIVDSREITLILKEFLKEPHIKGIRCCDNLYLIILMEKEYENAEYIIALNSLCQKYGYIIHKIGRKIYIMPHFLSKWAALNYIMKIEEEKEVIAAGDSVLDLCMLENSTKGFVPRHGELYSNNAKFHFSKAKGIDSSEELLEEIYSYINLKN